MPDVLNTGIYDEIIPVLAKNDIVDGIQGKGGGYRLTRRPEEYTLREELAAENYINYKF